MSSPKPAENWWMGWQVLTICTLFGAVVGFLVHRQRPPVYEAQVTFNIFLDMARTGSLDERETDHVLGTAGWLLTAGSVIPQAAQRAQAQGWPIDTATLASHVFVERLQNRWAVRVRDTNPQRAAQLANWIGELGLQQLQDAYSHALKAHMLRRHMDHLERCLEAAPSLSPAAPPPCNLKSLPQLQADMEATAAQLTAEALASHGLVPALTFGVLAWATPPTQPVLYGRTTSILVGTAIGIWVGLSWLVIIARREIHA